MPYEKIGKSEPVCIADEVPFEIPESWEWVRFSSIIELQSGQDMTPDKYNGERLGIPYITGASNIVNGKVVINRWTECGKAFAYRDDLLLTCKGTVGSMAILSEPQVHIARQIMAIRSFADVEISYIKVVLETLIPILKASAKSMIPGIAREDVLHSLLPLPPAHEQERICEKIKELLPHIEVYSNKENAVTQLNLAFPDTLKKSILQYAVQGKLVPQDPTDEPASVLLERIRTEKERLIKSGKIKRVKHESVIFRRDNSYYERVDGIERCIDDEIPFEIPESWEWVRIKHVGVITTGNTPSKTHPEYFGTDIPFVSPGDIHDGKIDIPSQGLSFEGMKVGRIIPRGSILQVCIGGSIGKAATCNCDISFNQQINAIEPIICNSKYLFYAISAPYFISKIKDKAGGTATPIISKGLWESMLIPLSPLKEQQQIATKINVLLHKLMVL